MTLVESPPEKWREWSRVIEAYRAKARLVLALSVALFSGLVLALHAGLGPTVPLGVFTACGGLCLLLLSFNLRRMKGEVLLASVAGRKSYRGRTHLGRARLRLKLELQVSERYRINQGERGQELPGGAMALGCGQRTFDEAPHEGRAVFLVLAHRIIAWREWAD